MIDGCGAPVEPKEVERYLGDVQCCRISSARDTNQIDGRKAIFGVRTRQESPCNSTCGPNRCSPRFHPCIPRLRDGDHLHAMGSR